MRSRSFLAFFPLICLLVSVFVPWGIVSADGGIIPLNVAVLPPYNGDKADRAIVEKVQAKIIRHFRYPYYEVINDADKGAILFAAMANGKKEKKRVNLEDAMSRIAQEIPADIVVMVEIAKARSYIYQRSLMFDGDTYEETYVVLNCYTYSAKDGKYDKKTVSARSFDTVGVFNGLDTIVPNLTDELLAKIPYKTIIQEE